MLGCEKQEHYLLFQSVSDILDRASLFLELPSNTSRFLSVFSMHFQQDSCRTKKEKIFKTDKENMCTVHAHDKERNKK